MHFCNVSLVIIATLPLSPSFNLFSCANFCHILRQTPLTETSEMFHNIFHLVVEQQVMLLILHSLLSNEQNATCASMQGHFYNSYVSGEQNESRQLAFKIVVSLEFAEPYVWNGSTAKNNMS